MFKAFISGALLAAVVAGTAIAAENNSKKSKDPNRVICRVEGEVGSRLRKSRVCHTAAEWEELRRQTRATVEHIEASRACNCGS